MSLCFAICSLLCLCSTPPYSVFSHNTAGSEWRHKTTAKKIMLGAKTFTSFFLFLLLPLNNFVVGTQHLAWVQTTTYPPPPLPIPSPTGVPLREKPTCTVMKNYLDSMFLNSGCSKPSPTLIKSRWRFKDYLHQHWWCFSQWKGPLLLNLKIIQINRNTLVTDIRIIP